MKSTLSNMVTVLFVITFVASAVVGIVYRITEGPIAEARAAAVVESLGRVLPPFETTEVDTMTLAGVSVTVYTAFDGNGTVAGYAVESASNNGFSGLVRLMVGFTSEGEVTNIDVLEQSETPGLGTRMVEEGNPLIESIRGRNPEQMQLVNGGIAVRKDGGDVDALTAATISSRAYCEAVNRAWTAYRSVARGEAPIDVSSGASDAASAEPDDAIVSASDRSDAASGATPLSAETRSGRRDGDECAADPGDSVSTMEKGGNHE